LHFSFVLRTRSPVLRKTAAKEQLIRLLILKLLLPTKALSW